MGTKIDGRLSLSSTDEQIRRVFLKTLAEDPNAKITISGLANEAGIFRSTFYRYYADIEDLAESCRLHVIEAIIAVMKEHFPEAVQGSAFHMVKAIFDVVDSNEDFFVVELVHKRLPPPPSSAFSQRLWSAMQADEELFRMLTYSEVKSSVDLAVVSFNIDFILGGMVSVVEGWLSRGGRRNLPSSAMAVQATGWFNVLAALCESNKESLRSLESAGRQPWFDVLARRSPGFDGLS